MTTVAITMVKDEADIVGSTVRHMLTQADFVIVADNMSTDDTPRILRDLTDTGRVRVVQDLDPAYQQSVKMTNLAHLAHQQFGADWVIPFDADEIWYSPFAERIADLLEGLAPQWLTASADIYDHVCTSKDNPNHDPVRGIGWRRDTPNPLVKVACRYRPDLVIEMGNHGAQYRGGTTVFPAGPHPGQSHLVIRHFPYRSTTQIIRKVRNGAAAYRLTDLPATYGAHWRQWGDILDQQGERAIEDLFHVWYYRTQPEADVEGHHTGALVYDPAPARRP